MFVYGLIILFTLVSLGFSGLSPCVTTQRGNASSSPSVGTLVSHTQKAWAYKFPFLAEHYECIPVNQRVNAWRNRINNSENVRYFTDNDPNVFEWDPNIGEDIRNLFSPDKEDIFDDDPNLGSEIEKLFREEK